VKKNNEAAMLGEEGGGSGLGLTFPSYEAHAVAVDAVREWRPLGGRMNGPAVLGQVQGSGSRSRGATCYCLAGAASELESPGSAFAEATGGGT